MLYIHDADIIKVTWEDSCSHCKCFQRQRLRPHKTWKQAAEFQLSYSLWEDILQSCCIVKALLEPALCTAEMKSHWCGLSGSILQFFCFGWFFSLLNPYTGLNKITKRTKESQLWVVSTSAVFVSLSITAFSSAWSPSIYTGHSGGLLGPYYHARLYPVSLSTGQKGYLPPHFLDRSPG